MKIKSEAEALGESMLKQINNPENWEVKAWNNLGWHTCLRNKKCNMVIYSTEFRHFNKILFSVSSTLDGHGVDEVFWPEPTRFFPDINQAVANKIMQMRYFRDSIDQHLKICVSGLGIQQYE